MEKIKGFFSSFFSDRKKRAISIVLILLLVAILSLVIYLSRLPSDPASSDPTTEQESESDGTPLTAPDATDQEPSTLPTDGEIEVDVIPEKEEQNRVPVAKGIDVSRWQGAIDWNKVKAAGIEFAMIRLGYRDGGVIYEDENATYNLQQAAKAGILTGVYFYSGATNPAQALEEANWVLSRLSGFAISYPVVLDVEVGAGQGALSSTVRTDTAIRFLQEVRNYGYAAMLYAPMSELENENIWDLDRLAGSFPVWAARYSTPTYPVLNYPQTEKNYQMWQYSDQGRVDGIQGNVDLNVAYFTATYQDPKDPSKSPTDATAPEDFIQSFAPCSENVTAKNEVNLRATPSIEGQIVGILKRGEVLSCTGKSDMGWSRLLLNGQAVYAVTSYLTSPDGQDPQTGVPGETYQSVTELVTAKEEVNLRTLPSTQGDVVTLLKHGTVITRTGIGDKGWSRLDFNGQVVYAITSYLEPAQP